MGITTSRTPNSTQKNNSNMSLSKIEEVLPRDYAYVILTAVLNNGVNFWMATRVARARKVHNVQYPDMYSADNKTFNCIQRAHQHTLELQPMFLMMLFVGGLKHPRWAAGCGVVYSLGRIAFARGYYTGDPANRRWGAIGSFGLLGLLGG